MTPNLENIEQAIGIAIGKALEAGTKGWLVTNWVTLVEVIDDEGDSRMVPFTSGGLTRWAAKGLLQHALDIESAAVVAEAVSAADD
jgi:hypothetical protein